MRITIDDKCLTVSPGQKVLWAALDNGIFIPHLCAIRGGHFPFASCRLCFVEIDGYSKPVTACTEEVFEGMKVKTRSGRVDRLVGAGFALIMSSHRTECNNCPRNGSCMLQKIAVSRGFKLNPPGLERLDRGLPVDDSHPDIVFNPNKCVLCGRCVFACREQGTAILDFSYRGYERMVTTFAGLPLGVSGCSGCGACAAVCPAGSFTTTG